VSFLNLTDAIAIAIARSDIVRFQLIST
jgi:hypothetical protein